MDCVIAFDAENCDIVEHIVKDGNIIQTPIMLDTLDGIKDTMIGIPCIYVEFTSGMTVLLKCFKEWKRNFILHIDKYDSYFGVPIKRKIFGLVTEEDERRYIKQIGETYNFITSSHNLEKVV